MARARLVGAFGVSLIIALGLHTLLVRGSGGGAEAAEQQVAAGDIIRAADFETARAEMTAVRAARGLGAFPWTDPVLADAPISPLHTVEMRMALEAACLAAGRPAPTYTNPIAANDPIRATDLNELLDTIPKCGPPAIVDFAPTVALFGTLVTVNGSSLAPVVGAPTVTLMRQGGGTTDAPVSTFANEVVTFVVPTEAATGTIDLTVHGETATSATPLTIEPAPIVVGSLEWRQLDDIAKANLDYDEVSSTGAIAGPCDPTTGACNGLLGTVDLTGWTWATATEVGDLLLAISEFPKGRKYLISLSFRGKASVRPAQVGGFDVNIVIHGSTAVRGRGDLVAYRWALWKLTAPWTHRTRPPHLGKRCAFSTSSTGPFPSNHSRKTPKGPKIALGNPDRPLLFMPLTPHPGGLANYTDFAALTQPWITNWFTMFNRTADLGGTGGWVENYFTLGLTRDAHQPHVQLARRVSSDTVYENYAWASTGLFGNPGIGVWLYREPPGGPPPPVP